MKFTLPFETASGPVTKLIEIVESIGVDDSVLAIQGGLDVFSTSPGGPLVADLSAAEILAKAERVRLDQTNGVR
jgi:hypothetical protein